MNCAPAHLTTPPPVPPRRHRWARSLGTALLGAAVAVGVWWATTVDNDLMETRYGLREVTLADIWVDGARNINGDTYQLDRISVHRNEPERPHLDDAIRKICPAPCVAEVQYRRTLSTYHRETKVVPVEDILIVGESLSGKINRICRQILDWGCWNSEIERVGRALSRGSNA